MADRVGQQLGNYRLIQQLGRGGFAEVYLGEHVHLGTQAAIKVLHTQLADKDTTEHFHKEARMIAQLVHPHIVRTLDFGVTDIIPFLVMDYASQGTLRQRHPSGSKVPLATVVTYVEQAAEALQYAHEQKIVHRDIKPENMLIGRRGEILLSDFGIAVVAHSTRSQGVQDLAGTIVYMSPEQLQGHPRPASDQYALGIITYEWLCGERPFRGTFAEVAAQHSASAPPSLRGRAQVSEEVEQVIHKALAKDSAQRFASVKDFAIALQKAYKTEYAAIQSKVPATDPPHLLQNNASVQPKPAEKVSSSPKETPTPPLAPTVAATPLAGLSTPPTPSQPSITTQPPELVPYPSQPGLTPVSGNQQRYSPPPPPPPAYYPQPYPYPYPPAYQGPRQPRQAKPKPPNVLPLRRGKLKLVDLPVILGYCGLLLFLILPIAYFGPLGSSGVAGAILFGTLLSATILLTGPLLGGLRGALATLLFSVGIVLYAQSQGGTSIYNQPGPFWLLAGWIVITLVTGWIYQQRKTRNFMLSWGILALESVILLFSFLLASNALQNDTNAGSTILTFIVIIFVASLITAILEIPIRAIVNSILKNRQQAR